MQENQPKKRTSKNALPATDIQCGFTKCTYYDNGTCHNPREKHQKEDALCHYLGNKVFLTLFCAGD